jgi:hypothetical protein
MKKRILALALTLAMLLSMAPVQVFATETEPGHTEHNFVEVQPEAQAPTEAPTEPPTEAPTDAPTEPSKDKGALTPQTPTPAPLAPADPLHKRR